MVAGSSPAGPTSFASLIYGVWLWACGAPVKLPVAVWVGSSSVLSGPTYENSSGSETPTGALGGTLRLVDDRATRSVEKFDLQTDRMICVEGAAIPGGEWKLVVSGCGGYQGIVDGAAADP